MKVLIVDDAKLGRMILKDQLQQLGHQVVGEACDGEEGFTLFNQLKPEVVVTDIEMPKMNGIELIDRIKEENPHTRFIVVSSVCNQTITSRALAKGAEVVLVKPLDRNKIQAVLDGENLSAIS